MPACPTKLKLMDAARETLSYLGELMQRQRDVLGSASEEEILTVDREIENQIGEKERRMGALSQHRREHGC